MIRLVLRITLGLALGFAAGIGAFGATIAAPGFAFAHARGADGITFHANNPLPPEAEDIARQISAELDASILGRGDSELSLFVTEGGWRDALFFSSVRQVGGIVYVPMTSSHAFLTGADFAGNRLKKGNYVIKGSRTLVYYGVHELAHIRTYERTGPLAFHALPMWVQEGLAEYVALGAPDAAGWDIALSNRPTTVAAQRRLGAAYPRERALVAWAVEHAGWSLDKLLDTRLTEAEILDRMRADMAVAGSADDA